SLLNEKWITASANALSEHRLVPFFAARDLQPSATAIKTCWRGQSEDIQQCRSKIDESKRRCDSAGFLSPARAQHHPNVDQFFRQLYRSMETSAVFQEFLSVICGNGQRTLVP